MLASFLVQDLETGGLNPFLLTYIANSLFIVYFPIYYFLQRLAAGKATARYLLPGPLIWLGADGRLTVHSCQ